MNSFLSNPVFTGYAITALLLCVNLLILWGYSGSVRGKSKKSPNDEDVSQFGMGLAETDPPQVARVLRAHRNAEASIYPFLFVGALFVLAGGSVGAAWWFFGIFTVARLLHSVAYIRRMQPWRTIFFVVGALTTIALMLDVAWLLYKGA